MSYGEREYSGVSWRNGIVAGGAERMAAQEPSASQLKPAQQAVSDDRFFHILRTCRRETADTKRKEHPKGAVIRRQEPSVETKENE